jgi:hypothetical protein
MGGAGGGAEESKREAPWQELHGIFAGQHVR